MNGTDSSTRTSGHPNRNARVIAGREIYFDDEGFLRKADDWDEEVARTIAEGIGLNEINEIQWRIIRFLREFYFYNGRAPMNRNIKAEIGLSFMELEALFPGGIRRGARKIAGLPNPKSCSG
jgi:dissimilatory sulfite reductase related protein